MSGACTRLGTNLYTSSTLIAGSATASIDVDVTGVDQLTLIVSDAGDSEDHAN